MVQGLVAARRRDSGLAKGATNSPPGTEPRCAAQVRTPVARAIQTEKDEPQPQVVEAFGFRITNCEPSRPSV
jgi:hypothetical protein